MFFLQCFLCEENKKGKYWAISLFGLCFVDNKCNDDQSCGYEIFILPRKQSNFANIAIFGYFFFVLPPWWSEPIVISLFSNYKKIT